MAKRGRIPWDMVLGAEVAGYYKPQREAYSISVNLLGLDPNQALMVGDTWNADVVGGRSLGIRTLHRIRYEIVDESNDEISTLRGVVEFLKHQQQKAR